MDCYAGDQLSRNLCILTSIIKYVTIAALETWFVIRCIFSEEKKKNPKIVGQMWNTDFQIQKTISFFELICNFENHFADPEKLSLSDAFFGNKYNY